MKFLTKNKTKTSLNLGKFRFISVPVSVSNHFTVLVRQAVLWGTPSQIFLAVEVQTVQPKIWTWKALCLVARHAAFPALQRKPRRVGMCAKRSATVCSASSSVEGSSSKLEVLQPQLKSMLRTPGHTTSTAVLWEKVNSLSGWCGGKFMQRLLFHILSVSFQICLSVLTGKRSCVSLHRVVYAWKLVFHVLFFCASLFRKGRKAKKLLHWCPVSSHCKINDELNHHQHNSTL